MIDDSTSWKRSLQQKSKLLAKISQPHGLVSKKGTLLGRQFVLAEEAIMSGAFAIRKLTESEKLSEEVKGLTLECLVHPPIERMAPEFSGVGRIWPSFFDREKVDEYFDMDSSAEEAIRIRDFLNQVIHSLVFELVISEHEGLGSLLVCSDLRVKRDEGLLSISATEIVKAFALVASDDPVQSVSFRDPSTWEMRSRKFSTDEGYAAFVRSQLAQGKGRMVEVPDGFSGLPRLDASGYLITDC